jgi:hypothetical protein
MQPVIQTASVSTYSPEVNTARCRWAGDHYGGRHGDHNRGRRSRTGFISAVGGTARRVRGL